MRTKITVRSFEQVLQILRDNRFDVASCPGSQTGPQARSPSANMAPPPSSPAIRNTPAKTAADDEQHPVIWITPPGWVLRGNISRLVDHGNQKLFETPTARIAATADALKAIHRFSEELREAIGEPSLYNESLGTVSNSYMYDRLKGREPGTAARPTTTKHDRREGSATLTVRAYSTFSPVAMIAFPFETSRTVLPCFVTTKNTTSGGPPLEGIVIVAEPVQSPFTV